MDNISNSPIVPEKTNFVFVILYMLILFGALGFVIYAYGLNFDNYTETDLVNLSYYFVPALLFSIVGLITVKKKLSILFALCSAIGAGLLLFVFFQSIWESL